MKSIVERLREMNQDALVYDRYGQRVEQAADILERARKVLESVERLFGENCSQCPRCHRNYDHPHAPDCELAALLKELGPTSRSAESGERPKPHTLA